MSLQLSRKLSSFVHPASTQFLNPSPVSPSSNRHLARGGFAHAAPTVIMNLCGGDVLLAEKVLDGFDA